MPTEQELKEEADTARKQSEDESAKADKLEEAADLARQAEEAKKEAENP